MLDGTCFRQVFEGRERAKKAAQILRRFFSLICCGNVYCVCLPTLGERVMVTTVELSEKRIGEEVYAIQQAARRLRAGRKDALAFLKRIGADGWPNSPTRFNESKTARRTKM